ncbi:MAG: hypothetical protein HYZ51_02610 [Candidatus Doudnabacteria bacterium]|nr:hypothetical protein [Candidatus Doudnabacteria bacterium]
MEMKHSRKVLFFNKEQEQIVSNQVKSLKPIEFEAIYNKNKNKKTWNKTEGGLSGLVYLPKSIEKKYRVCKISFFCYNKN